MVNVSSSGGVASGFATGNVAVTCLLPRAISDHDRGQLDWQHSMEQPQFFHHAQEAPAPETGRARIQIRRRLLFPPRNRSSSRFLHVTSPADLINDPDYGNNLTVKNVIGIGVNPNVSGQG